MTCRTHVVCASAATLALMAPETPKLVIVSLMGSTIGSVLPDIDSYNSESNQILHKIFIITMLTIIGSIVIENIFNLDIYNYIAGKEKFHNIAITFIAFLLLSIYGSKTPHRSFMHSILAVILFYFVCSFSFPNIFVYCFTIGMISHIMLDFFNHKGIMLFYPFRKRMCFNLCSSNKVTNKVLFCVFTVITLFKLIMI